MIYRNIEFQKSKPLSSWRKIAIGTWNTVGDPSVYGTLELDLSNVLPWLEQKENESGERITLTHFFGKAIAEVIRRHPAINSLLRFSKLCRRKDVDIFFQVATDQKGEDLSGVTIRNIDQKSLLEIAKEINARVHKVRDRTDTTYKKAKGLIHFFPSCWTKSILNFTSFILYKLNLWSPILGTPRDPMGSCMITNIGSLGLDTAYAPLVPYSHVPMVIAIAACEDRPVVVEGSIVIRPILRICCTFDHRVIDGLHAAQMCQTLREIAKNPAKEFGENS